MAILVRASGRGYFAPLVCRQRDTETVDTANDFIWEPSRMTTNLGRNVVTWGSVPKHKFRSGLPDF